jgi:Asp-tRNA(Asn)/Glu-tRNA(Gln) amidotransferase A subunit family amidase
LQARVQPCSPSLHTGLQGLRIGVLGGYFDTMATPAAREAVATAAHALGAQDMVTWPDAEQARAAAFIITASEGGQLHLDGLRTRQDDYDVLCVDRLIAGALQPAAWYVQAQRFRRAYRAKVQALFTQWDVLITAATPTPASPIGTEWVEIAGQRLPSRAAQGLLTQPISFAGCPVVAAPLWPTQANGLPLGVQLIAAPWREDLCLRAAMALQQAGVATLRQPSDL